MSMEALDLTLLSLLADTEKLSLYSPAIPEDLIEGKTKAILKDYRAYFKETGVTRITAEAFIPWFELAHPKLKSEPRAIFTSILKTALGKTVDSTVEQGILTRLEDLRIASKVTTALEQYNDGAEISISNELRSMVEAMPISTEALPFIEVDIDEMLDEDEDDWGFKWRLDCLNESMRPLRPGDFGIIAARVDQGKTTMFSSELSYMAGQVDELFPNEERNILILNNESLGKRINMRLTQSTLDASVTDLLDMRKRKINPWKEVLKQWGGRQVVRVYDVHDRPISKLELILRRMNPAIVVVDMLDNVPFDGGVTNNGQRTDQILEAAYQRARLWAVKYDCIVLATSQLSAEAAGVPFPQLHHLANSRTGKSGAADFVCMLGHSDSPELRSARWISLPKNKLHRAGSPKDPRAEVRFIADRGRIENPKQLGEPT